MVKATMLYCPLTLFLSRTAKITIKRRHPTTWRRHFPRKRPKLTGTRYFLLSLSLFSLSDYALYTERSLDLLERGSLVFSLSLFLAAFEERIPVQINENERGNEIQTCFGVFFLPERWFRYTYFYTLWFTCKFRCVECASVLFGRTGRVGT